MATHEIAILLAGERVKTFIDDDAGDEAWVDTNRGYVLIVRGKKIYMLHVSERAIRSD